MDSVQALNGYIFQCVYSVLGNITKSNAVKYLFIPPGQSLSQILCSTYRMNVLVESKHGIMLTVTIDVIMPLL